VVISTVSSSGILSKGFASNSVLEFCILKAFMVPTHATTAPKIFLFLFIGTAYAEISAIMKAIEYCSLLWLEFIWIKCDSLLVIDAFKKHHAVPWRLRSKWLRSQKLCSSMHVSYLPIYRKRNDFADRLAN